MTEEPKLAVYRAIAAITAALGKDGIAKTQQSGKEVGSGPKFKYRGIDDVYAALNPLLAQHNLCIIPRVIERTMVERASRSGGALFYTVIKMEFDFVSSEDGSKHTAVTYGEAMDSGDKGSPKAQSIALKYAAFMTFCIPVQGEDIDPDVQSHEVASIAVAKPDREAIARAEYAKAERLFAEARSPEEVDTIWKTGIEWTKIPRTWHDRVKTMANAADDRLKAVPKVIAAVVPKFDDLNDDIPF